jgi:phage-related protein
VPLELSSTVITEKNKLANADSVFLVALQITIPGVATPVRVVANTDNITWRGATWQALAFGIAEIRDVAGELPRVEVWVSNINRAMEAYLHQYDYYTKVNGYRAVECKIFVINTYDLANTNPVAEHDFILIQPKTTPQRATFILGASSPWGYRYPMNRMVPTCRWRTFKGSQCAYAGAETECNRTLTRCRELNNSHRFGGFYGTADTI